MIKVIITKENSSTEAIYSSETPIATIVADHNINLSRSLYANSDLVTDVSNPISLYAGDDDKIYLTSVVKTNNN